MVNCQRIVWVCLTILWEWRLKGYNFKIKSYLKIQESATHTWKNEDYNVASPLKNSTFS